MAQPAGMVRLDQQGIDKWFGKNDFPVIAAFANSPTYRGSFVLLRDTTGGGTNTADYFESVYLPYWKRESPDIRYVGQVELDHFPAFEFTFTERDKWHDMWRYDDLILTRDSRDIFVTLGIADNRSSDRSYQAQVLAGVVSSWRWAHPCGVNC